MTPSLGQGGCQAAEDAVVLSRLLCGADPSSVPAALAGFTRARMRRTAMITRRSRRLGAVMTWTSPTAVAGRNLLLRGAGRLGPRALLRSLAPVLDWTPPPQRPTSE